MRIPFVWTDAHRSHEQAGEVWVGVSTPGTEVPERAERIRAELRAAGAEQRSARRHERAALGAVHDTALVDYLAGAWDAWREQGLDRIPGAPRVVPYLFPHPGLVGSLPARPPGAASARAGLYCYDTMTAIGPGTWEAVSAAADAALTGAELVAAGERAVYVACRPPGHHACRGAFGGSCYLNNTALAAERLRADLAAPVAVIDIDAHHGNGTQEIFWERSDVLTASAHVDPGAGWFPHFLGFAGERGEGAGSGANLNLPLAPGSGDGPWLAAVERMLTWSVEAGAGALVAALGVDAAAADPESPLTVSDSAFSRAGELLAATGLPTVLVQEGGYDLDRIGPLVRTVLSAF